MNVLVFYEKRGCVGNRQQQAELRSQGISLWVRDLLAEPWTPEGLRPFFGLTPVREWFNPSAPAVKAGSLDIAACSEAEALALLASDPILIRRPLLELGGLRQSGYVDGPVLAALGLVLNPEEDLQSCPMGASPQVCGEST